MAEIIGSEPVLADPEAIADYIALENPTAAAERVQRIFRHVGQLAAHPESGSPPPELEQARYRQVGEPPCRVFYRYDGKAVFILHIMRSERLGRTSALAAREPAPRS